MTDRRVEGGPQHALRRELQAETLLHNILPQNIAEELLIEAHAEPGQILLSGSTFRYVHGEFGTEVRDP
jgi:hypothetical protein